MLIVVLGGLAPLIRQMTSPNVEVQCNAVGCITNLATHEDNKSKIARSGALGPLIRLAKSKDMRVQRNATGALLNMTHSGEWGLRKMNEFIRRLCTLSNPSHQLTTDNNSSTPVPFRSWFSCYLPGTLMYNTTVRLHSAISRSMRQTVRDWRRLNRAWSNLWSI